MLDAAAVHLAKLRILDAGASRHALSSYGLLIQHCADGGLLRHGLQLHSRLVLLSVVPDNFLGSKLISLYSRSGRLHDARIIFDAIPVKNLFSWNAMLLAYSVSQQPASFLRLFSSIPPSLRPDAFTISALLKSISAAAKEIHSLALRLGHHSADRFISNGLITAYLRISDPNSARKVFDRMPKRDIVSWNSIITGLSQEGHYSACIQLYQELKMGKEGVKPNGITVASVLHACSHLKDIVFGIGVHKFAVENGMGADIVVCNSIVGLYARCGSLEHARTLFDEMPEKDGVTYNTMISGYMAYGFINQAMDLFHQAGKWKEAQMVRKKMEEVGVGKVAGCSWIEGNGRMQVFISSDMANENSRQAFELIDELVGLMREEGYALAAKEELDEECCCC